MFFEELQKGMTITLEPARIEKEEMIAFAERYDNVPLHTDEEYARTTHFGQLIAPGVMSFMSVWAKYLEKDLFGTELIAGLSTKIEWFMPVFADDELTGTAVITNMTERNAKNGLVELTIDIVNQNGQLVMRDTTETVVKRKWKEQ
ncbi:MAG: MaoC family dehydratase N-terminal domain-containing protein [Oscillospiraceae bacterium]|nr:MaoC family dehydratase N-terminal domain-containing protein [Oscillospiraceae bacterium]